MARATTSNMNITQVWKLSPFLCDLTLDKHADAADSDLFHTPADIGWKSGCANRDIRPEMIE